MKTEEKLRLSLLLLRLGVFIVMFMWTLDKLVNPDHAIGIYKQFYFLSGVPTGIMYALGAAEMVIILGFVVGFMNAGPTASCSSCTRCPLSHLLADTSTHGKICCSLLPGRCWPPASRCICFAMRIRCTPHAADSPQSEEPFLVESGCLNAR